MNRKIGMTASLVNAIAVAGFAVCMLVGTNFGSYLSSTFIAFSFVPMISAYAYFSNKRARLAGITAVGFAVMYAVIICLVYFAQMTTVQSGGLTEQAAGILDFQKFGLFFNYDMLGYALMALSTFFAAITIEVKSKSDKCLKYLLSIHGIFFISSFVLPMMGLFTTATEGADMAGTGILIFWCIYFVPVGVLSAFHFSKYSSL